MKARTFNDLGIAGVMGAVLATRGAAWGLAVGIVLCLLIQLGNVKKYEDYIYEENTERDFNENGAEKSEQTA
jgi:hypothetical protein